MSTEHQEAHRLHQRGGWLRFHTAALALGLSLFAVNEAPVLAGYFAAPPGYTATFLPSSMDFPQYLTWINAYQRTKGWLLPDYHAPWTTEPALLNPFCWFVARVSAALGVNSLWIFHLAHLALTIAGVYALFFTLRAFTNSRTEARLALLVSFCCVPVTAVLALGALVFGRTNPMLGLFWWVGKVHDRYNADAFVNGIAGSPLVLFGTITTILCMGLLAKHLKTNRPEYLWWAGLVGALGALVHPFEILVVMGAGGLALAMRRDRPWTQAAREVACLVVPGIAGLAPYLYLTSRHPWLREAAIEDHGVALSPVVLVLALGFPALFCLISIVLPLGKRSVTDFLLLCWFGGSLIAVYVPGLTGWHHRLDGVKYATALLLIRQAARSDFMPRLWARRAAPVSVLLAVFLLASLAVRAINLTDATSAATVAGGPSATTIPQTDLAILSWLRRHAAPDDLVLAPKARAGWYATVPMHSFASHWLFSLTWAEQVRLSDGFYSGAMESGAAGDLLAGFGVRYAVIPDGSPAASYFSGQTPAARVGSAAIYRVANPGMRPFVPLR